MFGKSKNPSSKPDKRKSTPKLKVKPKNKTSAKKTKKQKLETINPNVSNIKYKSPSDEKYFKVSPIIAVISLLAFPIGFTMVHHNNTEYLAQQARIAMPKNTAFRQFSTSSTGTLTMGNIILSRDKKTVAIEVAYDDNAKRLLSSNGKDYSIYLVADKGMNIEKYKLTYSRLGTDKSGVLTVHSDKGFTERAFGIMLVDNSGIANQLNSNDNNNSNVPTTTPDTTTDGSTTDGTTDGNTDSTNNSSDITIDNITGGGDGTNSSSSSSSSDLESSSSTQKTAQKPMYYVIVNPSTLKASTTHWGVNTDNMLYQLFVTPQIKQTTKDISTLKTQIKGEEKVVNAYQSRVSQNANDTVASTNLSSEQAKLTSLQTALTAKETTLSQLKTAVINASDMKSMQTHRKYYPNALDKLRQNDNNNGDN